MPADVPFGTERCGAASSLRVRRSCSARAQQAARAIQELAGHQDLGTTQRYMHLSPAALDAAIRLLETPVESGIKVGGEIVEAQGTSG
jgi:integrase